MKAMPPYCSLLGSSARDPARGFLNAYHDVVQSGAERVAHLLKLLHIVKDRGRGLPPDSRREWPVPQILHVLLVGSNVSQHGLNLREQVEAVDFHRLGMFGVEPG